MGTRLYPTTKNPRIIEILARVPEGTAAKLTAIENKYLEQSNQITERFNAAEKIGDEATLKECRIAWSEVELEKSQEIDRDDDLEALYHFELYGWGKVTNAAYALAIKHGDAEAGTIGSVTNINLVNQFLLAQGVTLPDEVKIEDLEGIGWS